MADGRDTNGRFAPGAEHPRLGGRKPKLRRIDPLLEMIGAEEVEYKGQQITKLEAVLRAVYGYALKGQSWAVQFIAERTEGKVREVPVQEERDLVPVEGLTFRAKDRTVGA